MKTDSVTNLNFKSKIVIVSPRRYEHIEDSMCERKGFNYICNWDIVPKFVKEAKFRAYYPDSKCFTTQGVRTCSGLVVANKGKDASLVAHVGNSVENFENLSRLDNFISGTNAILVGSKKRYDYSKEVYEALEKKIKDKKIPLTIMKNLKLRWEVDMAYDSLEDKLFMCVKRIDSPEYVTNLKQLKRVFSKIKISKLDSIEFLTKQKPTIWQRLKSVVKKV